MVTKNFTNDLIFRETLYMGKKKKYKKHMNNIEIWTEEEYEEYLKGLYGLEYIAGYTENGMPYGLPAENDNDVEIYNADELDNSSDCDEELPF